MNDWWSETDRSILECLREAGPVSPGDLGRRVGISEGEATAFLCMLATQGKVRIRLAELNDERAGSPTNGGLELPRRARAGARRERRTSRGYSG
jgi:DNA-binding Lrp family transcriptional regulator